MPMNKILRAEDLMEISNFFLDKKYNNENVTILIEVEDEHELNRVNDDFYYRFNDGKDIIDEDFSSVDINIGGIKFKYKVKETSK